MSHYVERFLPASAIAYGPMADINGLVYNAFVPDHIGDLRVSFPLEVTAQLAKVENALRLLNRRRDQSQDNVSPRLLTISESIFSSRIERIEAPWNGLAKAMLHVDGVDNATTNVTGNIRATEHALELGVHGRPFSVQDLLHLHQLLLGRTAQHDIAGKLRDTQVTVGGFYPPPKELLPGLVDDLCGFINRDDLSPIAQAAIAHAQFETIHPFADGNGRVGRSLIHLILARRAVTSRVVPMISESLAADLRAYFRGLRDYREDRVAMWCGDFGAALHNGAHIALSRLGRIEALDNRWRRLVREAGVVNGLSVIPGLITHPAIDRQRAAELTGLSLGEGQAVCRALQELGVLRAIRARSPDEPCWLAKGAFAILKERAVITGGLRTGPGSWRR